MGSHWNFVKAVGLKKQNSASTRMSTMSDDMRIHIDPVITLNRETDRRTDGRRQKC